MQPLREFDYLAPASLDEAAGLLGRFGRECRIVAGGTDLLPSMRQGLFTPAHVVSLQNLDALREIAWDDAGLRIGALATLRSVESHPEVRRRFPLVAFAAAAIASPTIRQMGTVGGNLCLDTRCYYYNQSESWRSCSTPCLKMGGEFCKASPGGLARKCFAAFSADLAPALVALDARIALVSRRGTRTLALSDFYSGDGAKPNRREDDEIVTHIVVPKSKLGCLGVYHKHRMRNSIDYPTAAVTLTARPLGRDAIFEDIRLVVSGVVTQPLIVKGVSERLAGKPLDDASIIDAAKLAKRAAIPVANTAGERRHRKHVIYEYTRRAFADILREERAQ